MQNEDLKHRIIDISYRHNLSHLGSCLTAVDIIDEIYARKRGKDRFVLGPGHSGLALYVVLEKYYGINAESLLLKDGIHPCFSRINKIDCSTGSLGQGLPIAIGMAIADKSRNIYVLESDGSMMEGSNLEALRIAADNNIKNLYILFNFNGFSAYQYIDIPMLKKRIKSFVNNKIPYIKFYDTNMDEYPEWIRGLQSHYKVLNDVEFKEMVKC
jgi:transketolase